MNLFAIFFIISALGSLACFAYSIYRSIELKNNPKEEINYTLFFKRIIPLIIGFGVGAVAMVCFGYGWFNISPKPYEVIQGVIGGALFFFFLSTFVNSFIVYYYRRNLRQKLHEWLFRIMMIAFGATVVFMFVMTNGFADYLSYPLVNGISFKEGFVKPGQNTNVAFYALCILSGALYVYFLCDHKYYIEYGKHGILESTFLVAFPAGIIGARIFYVIGNFNVPSSQGGFDGVFDGRVFAIWEGGLTILGGAIMGIVVGVLFYLWKNRKYNIWLGVDIIVPTILIAQAIGRWGNFFNCEVHGLASDENLWLWLPRIVWNNMHWSTADGAPSQLTDGTLYVPLFFIESIINLVGFGVLAHLFGIKLRKHSELGDIAFGYIIWYGLTRVILEPLRDPSYNMGKDGYWSWVWSMAFMIVGAVLIFANHILKYYLRKKANKEVFRSTTHASSLKALISLGGVSIALIIAGAVMMINGTFAVNIAYSLFNSGLIILIVGITVLVFALIALFTFVCSKNITAKVEEANA